VSATVSAARGARVAPFAADPRVPGRDTLLDAREMTARLSRLLGEDGPVRISRYGRGRVKYRIGDSLRVVHEVRVAGTRCLVASRTFPDGRSQEVYERALARAEPAGTLRAVAHDPELEAVFWTFPNDRKIPNLAALGPATAFVSELIGRRISRTELVAYAPEKAATVACFDAATGRPAAYAKVYCSAEEAAHAHRVHSLLFERLGSVDPGLRLPAVLGYAPDERMLVVEALPGRRIDTIRGSDRLGAMRAFGTALAALHDLVAPNDDLPPFERLDPARQCTAAEIIGAARPDVAEAASRLAAELADRAPAAEAPPVCLHGDVHFKNGLLTDERVSLIDLDQAGLGPAAADVGSAIAKLRYQSLLTGDTRRVRVLQHALTDGYRSRRTPPAGDELRWHVAAAILSERALRAVNRVRLDGLALLPAVLDEALAVLREGVVPR
jgi:tRNA A-37 threonylcarbamoyl transferase component Bud32